VIAKIQCGLTGKGGSLLDWNWVYERLELHFKVCKSKSTHQQYR